MVVTPQQILSVSAVLLSVFFFISGINKLRNVSGVSKGLAQKLPFLGKSICFLTICGVVALEILAPILIVAASLGYYTLLGCYSCYALALFTILANFLYHYPPKKANYHPFMRNLAIIGGLLSLSLHFR